MSTQIAALPDAPAATDPVDTFDAKAFAFNAALASFRTQANALGQEMQINADVAAALILAMALPQFAGTSTSSVTVGTGTRTFTTQAGKGWLPGQIVVVSSGANYVKGTVTDYTGSDLELNVTSINGSGTYATWSIGLSYDGLALADAGDNENITRLLGLVEVPDVVKAAIAQIMPLPTPTMSGGALTIPAQQHWADFRNASLGQGGKTTLSGLVPAFTIPAGATLGASNGTETAIAVLLLNNGTSMERAVTNLAGGLNISETGVISTTAISAAADSAGVAYSAIARTNVPYRLEGVYKFNQATAGTYASACSLVQGAGGRALAALQGATVRDETANRVLGATYLNDSDFDRDVYVRMNNISGMVIGVYLNGAVVQDNGTSSLNFLWFHVRVRPWETYKVDVISGSASIGYWKENY